MDSNRRNTRTENQTYSHYSHIIIKIELIDNTNNPSNLYCCKALQYQIRRFRKFRFRLWECESAVLLVVLPRLSWLVRLKVSMLEAGGPGQYWGAQRVRQSLLLYNPASTASTLSSLSRIIWLKPPALRLGEILQYKLCLFNNILITITCSPVIASISPPLSPLHPATEFINSYDGTDVYTLSLSSFKKISSKVGNGQLNILCPTLFFTKECFLFSFPWKADIEDIHLCWERKANFM